MWELFALGVYSLQWLGIVLGVGAQAVALIGHLSALHEHKPQWLADIPAVRAVQGWGLGLIIASGLAAVAYQSLIDPSVLAIPTFGFKWALIAVCTFVFILEKHLTKGRATLEGIAGATWLALFLVHSLAPIFDWVGLGVFYGAWLAFFLLVWGSTVWLMRQSAPSAAAVLPKLVSSMTPAKQAPSGYADLPAGKSAEVASPSLRKPPPGASSPTLTPVKPVVPPPLLKPIIIPHPVVAAAPVPPPAPMPQMVVKAIEVSPPLPQVAVRIKEHVSLWQQLLNWMHRPRAAKPVTPKPVVAAPTPPPAPPKPVEVPIMARVSAPVPAVTLARAVPMEAKLNVPEKPPQAAPSNLPVVEHLELMAPAKIAQAMPEPTYVPDWAHLPGVRVMPQSPDEVHKQNRAPVVQIAAA